MIKAVIFDFFGVIRSDDFWQFLKRDPLTDIAFNELAGEVNIGAIGWKTFVNKVAQAAVRTPEEINAMYAAEKIDPLVVGMIHELHKNYKTGLLTNASQEFIEPLLKEHHLAELFDAVVVSSRLGFIKPDPRIFKEMLTQLNIKPAEAVYVDDLERHVNGANALGMNAILFRNYRQCKKELDAVLKTNQA